MIDVEWNSFESQVDGAVLTLYVKFQRLIGRSCSRVQTDRHTSPDIQRH